MADNLIRLPFSYYPNPNIARPVFNGQVAIATAGTAPNDFPANLKTIVDSDGTPLPNPISISAGGVVNNGGTPVEAFTDGNYAMLVTDSDGVQIYYVEDRFDGEPITADNIGSFAWLQESTAVSAAALTTLAVGDAVRTQGRVTSGDGGENDYVVVPAAAGTNDGFEFIDTASNNQLQAIFPGNRVSWRQGNSTPSQTNTAKVTDFLIANPRYVPELIDAEELGFVSSDMSASAAAANVGAFNVELPKLLAAGYGVSFASRTYFFNDLLGIENLPPFLTGVWSGFFTSGIATKFQYIGTPAPTDSFLTIFANSSNIRNSYLGNIWLAGGNLVGDCLRLRSNDISNGNMTRVLLNQINADGFLQSGVRLSGGGTGQLAEVFFNKPNIVGTTSSGDAYGVWQDAGANVSNIEMESPNIFGGSAGSQLINCVRFDSSGGGSRINNALGGQTVDQDDVSEGDGYFLYTNGSPVSVTNSRFLETNGIAYFGGSGNTSQDFNILNCGNPAAVNFMNSIFCNHPTQSLNVHCCSLGGNVVVGPNMSPDRVNVRGNRFLSGGGLVDSFRDIQINNLGDNEQSVAQYTHDTAGPVDLTPFAQRHEITVNAAITNQSVVGPRGDVKLEFIFGGTAPGVDICRAPARKLSARMQPQVSWAWPTPNLS